MYDHKTKINLPSISDLKNTIPWKYVLIYVKTIKIKIINLMERPIITNV